MNKVKKFSFQAAFVFLLLLTLPIDPGYYRRLFTPTDGPGFQALFRVLDYVPFLGYAGEWGLRSFLGWGVALGAALIIATVWFVLDRDFEENYERWNYWLRLILRYRLAIALFTYGFLLFFPLQAPFPSLSDFHTKYGEFLPWKIYYHSLGVSAAGYEPILGFAEILAGALLLWRRTVVLGAGLAAAILINIVLVNFAYDLGSHLLSVYLLLIASVLLVHDAPRLYALLIREGVATADHYRPYFSERTAALRKWGRIVLPVFFLFYGFLAYGSYRSERWPYPASKGIAGTAGYYDVSHFALNGTELPYTFTDSIRWQNVVFEEWNTISVRVNKPLTPNLNGPFIHTVRGYESEGNGGRIFYTYTLKDGVLELVNQQDNRDVYRLTIKQSDGNILLYGKDHYGRDLHIGLNKLDKKYLLHLGRRKPVKVY